MTKKVTPQLCVSAIVESAWQNLLSEIEKGKIKLLSEGDLQAHLFYELRIISNSLPNPVEIHAEDERVDLTLGRDVVHIELKFPKEGAGEYTSQRKDIFLDLQKLGSSQADHAYLGIVRRFLSPLLNRQSIQHIS